MKVVLLFLLLACSTAQPLPEPASLTSPAFAIDSHLHLTMASAAHPFFVGMAGRDAPVESTGAQLRNQIDPVQLRSAGVKLVFAALWPPPASRPGRSAFDETLRQKALKPLERMLALG